MLELPSRQRTLYINSPFYSSKKGTYASGISQVEKRQFGFESQTMINVPTTSFSKNISYTFIRNAFPFSLPHDEKSNACIEENVKLSAEKAD